MTIEPGECEICRELECRPTLPVRGVAHWSARPHPAPVPIAGWTVLDLRRHAEGWHQLERRESEELGHAISRVSAAIIEATRCDRVYLIGFAEAVRHTHLHLVPRHGGDDRTRSWGLADLYRDMISGRAAAPDTTECADAAARIARVLAR